MPKRTKRLDATALDYAPAIDPQSRENQLIAAATNLAEKQLLDGTASSQVIVHYLRLATAREKTEREILELQKELVKAKTEAIKASQQTEELYRNAINAMRGYMGLDDDQDVQ